jgi:hypothetical protein
MPHIELRPPVTQSGENLRVNMRECVCVGRNERVSDYLTVERERDIRVIYIYTYISQNLSGNWVTGWVTGGDR